MANNAAKPEVLYDHTQRAWWRIPFGLILAAAGFGVAMAISWLSGSTIVGILVGVIVITMGTRNLINFSMRIRIDTAHISWHMATQVPGGHHLHTALVTSCRREDASPWLRPWLRLCGGGVGSFRAFGTGTPHGVAITTQTGHRFWLGTDEPDAVLDAIRRAVGPQAWSPEPGVVMCHGRSPEGGDFRDEPWADAEAASPSVSAEETQE